MLILEIALGIILGAVALRISPLLFAAALVLAIPAALIALLILGGAWAYQNWDTGAALGLGIAVSYLVGMHFGNHKLQKSIVDGQSKALLVARSIDIAMYVLISIVCTPFVGIGILYAAASIGGKAVEDNFSLTIVVVSSISFIGLMFFGIRRVMKRDLHFYQNTIQNEKNAA